jgi:hypothetical protein
MFASRKLIIATKHHKESVIAPLLKKELGVHCYTSDGFDTDAFGTFTGEMERNLDPVATVKEKCLRAMEDYGCDLGIASEGSFGPHPTLFFVNAGDELLVLIDKKNNLEIMVRELSTETNFNGQDIRYEDDLKEFANRAGFPSHGLILRKSREEKTDIIKDIRNLDDLLLSFEQLVTKHGQAYVETDMRAMNNPTRMGQIAKAAEKLLAKIQSSCPGCRMPGFGVTEAKKGLECRWCGNPTNSILSYLYVCQKCHFTHEEMYPNQKSNEDPAFCDHCNP